MTDKEFVTTVESFALERDAKQAIEAAVATNDFRDVGHLLAEVRPPDNGWFAFLRMIDCAERSGIDYVVVDHARPGFGGIPGGRRLAASGEEHERQHPSPCGVQAAR